MRWHISLPGARRLGAALTQRRRGRPRAAGLVVEELERRTLLSFTGPVNYSWGYAPWFLAVGDFDRDGLADVAAAGQRPPFGPNASWAFAVFLNAGGGGALRDPVVFPVKGTIDGFVQGDFNGDARPDLAYSTTDGRVTVHLGNGDGTFRKAVRRPGLSDIRAVADFDGDGRDDLARPGQVHLSNGDGTFRLAATYSIPAVHRGMTAADLNGDGRPDLVVMGRAIGPPPFPPPPSFPGLHVLLNTGDGTFAPPVRYAGASTGYLSGLAVGDIHGDGIPDVVHLNGAYRGNGDGTFQTDQGVPEERDPVALALADFNGDGRADVALPSQTYSEVNVYLSNGDGTFRPRLITLAGNDPWRITTADFNADGRPDLLVGNIGSADLSVRLGNGDGTFDTGLNLDLPSGPSFGANDVAAGDLNGDGFADLVTANNYDGSASVLLSNGDGTFQPAQTYPTGTWGHYLTLAYLDGDGALDVAVSHTSGNSVRVLLNNGDGTFRVGESYTLNGASDVTAADLDRDGRMDLALALSYTGAVAVLRGNGDGMFQPAMIYSPGGIPRTITTADLNADGAPDLVVGNWNGSADLFLNNGDGTFGARRTLQTGPRPGAVVAADFDRDGFVDLAFADDGPNGYDPGDVWTFRGNGNGTFGPPRRYAAGRVNHALAAADFDADGHLDLVVGVGSGLRVLWGNGDGTFREDQRSHGAASWVSGPAVGDFNGDGQPDLAFGRAFTSPTVSVLFNQGGRMGGYEGPRPAPGVRLADVIDALVIETLRPKGGR